MSTLPLWATLLSDAGIAAATTIVTMWVVTKIRTRRLADAYVKASTAFLDMVASALDEKKGSQ